MIKASAQSTRADTKAQLVNAALTALKTEGFAGATSRAIARIGGFNQALIFYHFGSVDGLLLAALDATSEARMTRYREALARAVTPADFVGLATEIYREDRDSGHVTVVAQMIAGSLARRDLAPEVLSRMEPWIDFCEEALRKFLAGSSLAAIAPFRDLAYAFATFYLGINLLAHLDEGGERTDALFAHAAELAPLLSSVLAEGER
jgi:AcrR family transcriptional regulator